MSLKSSLFILSILFLPIIAIAQDTSICEDVPDFGYVASDEDCYIYFQCINGSPHRLQCPRGTYFSTARQTCVPYDESDCPLMSTTAAPPGELTCSDVPEFGYIPSLEQCDRYFQCIDGRPHMLKCPRGFYFSFRAQNCVIPGESDCPLIFTTTTTGNPFPTCNDVDEFEYVPSMRGCEFYYQCINSGQYLLECPRGLYFSFTAQNCVQRDESECWI